MWQRLRDELRSPFNFVTGLIAVIGIIFSIYTWHTSRQVAEISYAITHDKNYGSPYGNLGKSHDVRVVIWNSGNVELGLERIRHPLGIEIIGDCSVTLSDYSRKMPGTFGVHLDTEDNNHRINFKWDHFDPGEYISVYFQHNCDDYVTIRVVGKINGVVKFIDATPPDFFKYYFEIIGYEIMLCNVCLIILAIAYKFLPVVFALLKRPEKFPIGYIVPLLIFLSFLVTLAVGGVGLIYWGFSPISVF